MPESIEHIIILAHQNNYYIHVIEGQYTKIVLLFELISPWVCYKVRIVNKGPYLYALKSIQMLSLSENNLMEQSFPPVQIT